MSSNQSKAQMIYTFMNSFGCAAYDTVVPQEIKENPLGKLPYIVYSFSDTQLTESALFPFSLYSDANLGENSTEAIITAIETNTPKLIQHINGNIWINRASPFIQRRTDIAHPILARLISFQIMQNFL